MEYVGGGLGAGEDWLFTGAGVPAIVNFFLLAPSCRGVLRQCKDRKGQGGGSVISNIHYTQN